MAMLIQYLSAKLGVVTDRNLPELCREHYPRPVAWGLWIQAEVMAMATDVAEFIGAALGLNLLFGVPLLPAGAHHRRDRVRAPRAAAARLPALRARDHGVSRADPARLPLRDAEDRPFGGGAAQGLVPHLRRLGSVYLAVGIIGATVMPHVIYLHSALMKGRTPVRNEDERRHVLRFERIDVIVALGLAGLVNMAMLAVAAKLFHDRPGWSHVDTLQGAHAGFSHLVGGTAALTFAVALFASGVSSSSVGTYAGQVVMAGFVDLRISLLVRRGADDDPGARHARDRRQPDERARAQPGRALLRDPLRPRPAASARRGAGT